MRNEMLMVLGPFILLSNFGAATPDDPPGGRTFELEEGVADAFLARGSSLVRGAYAYADEERPEGLLGAPVFVSEKPHFGVFPLGARRDPSTEGRNLFFALDERDGTGSGHDRIYFDLDEDGDLADETARMISKTFALEFDLGEEHGKRTVSLQPVLHSLSSGRSLLYLYASEVHHGKVEIGDEKYEVVLSQGYYLTGRYDLPYGLMVLTPEPGSEGEPDEDGGVLVLGFGGSNVVRRTSGNTVTYTSAPRWWSGADRLDAVRYVGGKYYTFSATSDGSRFTVTPYDGALGAFKVGAGGREAREVTASGSLLGDRSVPIGKDLGSVRPDPATECRLPVGDYRPYRVTVRYDSLTVDASFNTHADGKPSGLSNEPPINGIEIREDQTFLLDFSNEPEIVFTQPVELQRFERGATIRIEAVLTDPKLGLMIRDIERWEQVGAAGLWSNNESLDPRVTVIDSAGEVRATGDMPFG